MIVRSSQVIVESNQARVVVAESRKVQGSLFVAGAAFGKGQGVTFLVRRSIQISHFVAGTVLVKFGKTAAARNVGRTRKVTSVARRVAD